MGAGQHVEGKVQPRRFPNAKQTQNTQNQPLSMLPLHHQPAKHISDANTHLHFKFNSFSN